MVCRPGCPGNLKSLQDLRHRQKSSRLSASTSLPVLCQNSTEKGMASRLFNGGEDVTYMRCVRIIGGVLLFGLIGLMATQGAWAAERPPKDPKALAEEFGIIVGPVTEDIRKELNLRSAEGVAVFEIIGDSLADLAGIKVHAVITEINSRPVRNLDEFGKLLTSALEAGNFTIGTWEPTTPDDQGAGQQMNFHFVPNRLD